MQGLALSDALMRSCNWKISSFPKDKCAKPSAKAADGILDSLFGSSPLNSHHLVVSFVFITSS